MITKITKIYTLVLILFSSVFVWAEDKFEKPINPFWDNSSVEKMATNSSWSFPLLSLLIKEILKYVWIIWILVIIWWWISFMLADGKQDKIKKITKMMIYASIGCLVAFMWYFFVDIINTIKIW